MSDDIGKKISEADLPNQKFRFEITSEFETHFRFFLKFQRQSVSQLKRQKEWFCSSKIEFNKREEWLIIDPSSQARTFAFNHPLLLVGERKGFELKSWAPLLGNVLWMLRDGLILESRDETGVSSFCFKSDSLQAPAVYRHNHSMCKWYVNENNYEHNRYLLQLPFQARGFRDGKLSRFPTLENGGKRKNFLECIDKSNA